jgi:hypothetical protein
LCVPCRAALGEGGERLHRWVYDLASWRERHRLAGGETDADAEVLDESFKNTGAVLVGRRMFDVALLDEIQIHLVPVLLGDGV